jgi:hypothetical protein
MGQLHTTGVQHPTSHYPLGVGAVAVGGTGGPDGFARPKPVALSRHNRPHRPVPVAPVVVIGVVSSSSAPARPAIRVIAIAVARTLLKMRSRYLSYILGAIHPPPPQVSRTRRAPHCSDTQVDPFKSKL